MFGANARGYWVVVMMLASLLIAGACARTAPSPAPAPPAAPKPAPPPLTTTITAPKPAPAPAPAAPKPTGTLTVALDSFHTELFGADQTSGQSVVHGVYEYLVAMGPGMKVEPQLAERWEMSPDGKIWTFYLRKGVQFHDGWGEMTAADVKFSIEEGGKKGALNAVLSAWMARLDKIEIVDPYVIRLHSKKPYPGLLVEAGNHSPRALVVSKKYYEAVGAKKAAQHPIGTGPYKFVEHKLGESIILEAVEKHWRVTPGFQYVKKLLVPENATRIAMLKSGQIDITHITPANVDELKAAGVKIIQTPGGSDAYIGLGGQILKDQWPKEWDPTIPWVGDPANPASVEKAYKVRVALNLAIDKESIARNILKGAGGASILPLYYVGQPYTDPKWKPTPYDPAKAKQLLAEAGYPNGIQFDFWTFSQPGRDELPDIAQAVAMYWNAVGVKTRIRLTDSAGIQPLQTNRKIGYAAFTEGVPVLSSKPDQMYTVYFYGKPGTGRREKGIEDPRLIDFQDKIIAEVDPVKQAALMRQRGQLMLDNSWIVPLVYKPLVWATGPKVAQWTPIPLSQYPANFEYATPAK